MVTASGPESGRTSKIVPIASNSGAVVALFPDGRAFYSADGLNLAGGGATVAAYGGQLQVIDVEPVGGGVDTLFSDGSVFFSPDGQNLGGGGTTVRAYSGSGQVASLSVVGGGVDAAFLNGGGAFYSPDGLNLGGGGNSVQIYAGPAQVAQIVATGSGDAVVTLFTVGSTFYSPDNRSLGGGGSTIDAASATHVPVILLVKVGSGIMAQLENGSVYLSADGQNLDGGGATVRVPDWKDTIPNGPFPARDSARGASFLGRLWISGGFSDATDSNSCFVTCSFFDLWSSTDSTGNSWNTSPSFATATAPDPRDATPVVDDGVQDAPLPADFYDSYSALIVWNQKLTAIGSTVWSSADGSHWVENKLADGVTPAPGPVPIPPHATENTWARILNGTLYLLQLDLGEVWSTTDPNAAAWTALGPIQNFTPRCGAATFVLQGKLWVEGGGACDYSRVYNDVWSSPDGVHWAQSATNAQWSGRMWPCVATGGDGIMWLAAGYAPTDWTGSATAKKVRYGANHSDVWYSRDGNNWKQFKADDGSGLTDDGGLEPRHAPTCYVTAADGLSLLIIGGTGGPDPNDANAGVVNSIRELSLPLAATLP